MGGGRSIDSGVFRGFEGKLISTFPSPFLQHPSNTLLPYPLAFHPHLCSHSSTLHTPLLHSSSSIPLLTNPFPSLLFSPFPICPYPLLLLPPPPPLHASHSPPILLLPFLLSSPPPLSTSSISSSHSSSPHHLPFLPPPFPPSCPSSPSQPPYPLLPGPISPLLFLNYHQQLYCSQSLNKRLHPIPA
ncbi:hypothetical protein JAAARDRAFT_540619 [Jaapia argillacea MUCL 33604]|uniref:Uncharacterized protein n=1 Tax=Jaapia argillacea MUCL 33604 TaxID=933084 RepID=A0A067PJ25_9AGAM|nr:hypothetical protein JAAARDRAFT_540619 [Jaapia argillacea MUCL 33604]